MKSASSGFVAGAKWAVSITGLSGSMKGPSWEKDIHNDQDNGGTALERQPKDSGDQEKKILQVKES